MEEGQAEDEDSVSVYEFEDEEKSVSCINEEVEKEGTEEKSSITENAETSPEEFKKPYPVHDVSSEPEGRIPPEFSGVFERAIRFAEGENKAKKIKRKFRLLFGDEH